MFPAFTIWRTLHRSTRLTVAPLKPAVLVAGLGRCGTSLMYEAIADSSRLYAKATFVVDLAGARFRGATVYKTHDFPPPRVQPGVKVIFMFGNPMNAAISSYENLDERHYRHVRSPHAADHDLIFDKDVLLMEEHFDRWMQPQAFPFLSIRYEDLFDDDVIQTVSDYIGQPVQLPMKQPRRADWRWHPERDRLEATYGRLAEKVAAAPRANIWLPIKDERQTSEARSSLPSFTLSGAKFRQGMPNPAMLSHLYHKGLRSSRGLTATFAAVAVLMLAGLLWTQPTQAHRLAIDAFIQRWDANRDGMINRDELRKMTGNRLEKLVDKLFQTADRNQDGRLDKDELNSPPAESFFLSVRDAAEICFMAMLIPEKKPRRSGAGVRPLAGGRPS